MAVHLRGAMLLARASLPSMVERGSGRVVVVYGNLGDRGSPRVYDLRGGAGLLRLVDQFHAELEGTGVWFGSRPWLSRHPGHAAAEGLHGA